MFEELIFHWQKSIMCLYRKKKNKEIKKNKKMSPSKRKNEKT